MNKYLNVKTIVDGRKFDSKLEAKIYNSLKLLKQAGEVDHFECQVPFQISVEGKKICVYKADFVVTFATGKTEVWDAKGVKTPIYNLKKKLLKATHGIDIVEITGRSK